MDLASYRTQASTLAADLVNTVGSISGTDFLTDVEDLRRLLEGRGLEVPTISERDLAEVKEVREALRAVFVAPTPAGKADLLNEILRRYGAVPQLTEHEERGWHLHFHPHESRVADELGAMTAVGLAALVADLGIERLGICRADDCADVFVDVSRNRSRRYCADACSNRMNVARHRERARNP